MAKSYYEEQIARARKTLADAAAGKGFAAAVKQLQDKSRIKDSLKDLPARGAIVSKRVIGRRSGSASSSGAVRTEQSRSYFTRATASFCCSTATSRPSCSRAKRTATSTSTPARCPDGLHLPA